MRKKMGIFLTVFSLAIVLSGCAVKNSNNSVENNNSKKEQNQTNFSQPDRQADITGVVKSITGNQVVVSKLDMEKMMAEMKANMPSSTSNNIPSEDSAQNKKTSSLVQTSGVPGGIGGGPQGGPGGRPGEENSDSSSTQKNEMLAELLKNSLGDEQVLIPVGIQMTKRGGEASLSDVTAGTMVSIWLTDISSSTDRKIAEFVSLR